MCGVVFSPPPSIHYIHLSIHPESIRLAVYSSSLLSLPLSYAYADASPLQKECESVVVMVGSLPISRQSSPLNSSLDQVECIDQQGIIKLHKHTHSQIIYQYTIVVGTIQEGLCVCMSLFVCCCHMRQER